MGGGGLTISISNSSGKPIYEQITIQIKSQIASGALAPGDALPSIRLLAKELRISVITTKRAYADLEQLGYICTVQGKGCFVAEGNQELLRENQLCHIEELLAQAATQAETLGVTRDKLHEMLNLVAPETMQ
jgi:GntR family transcriptional regulator